MLVYVQHLAGLVHECDVRTNCTRTKHYFLTLNSALNVTLVAPAPCVVGTAAIGVSIDAEAGGVRAGIATADGRALV